MKIPTLITVTILGTFTLGAHAQDGMRMPDPFERLSRKDKQNLQNQASQIFDALKPVVQNASKSTLAITARGQRITFGTAVTTKDSTPAIITKWSEIAPHRNALTISTADDKRHSAKVVGIYPEHDLAVLKTNATLTPLDLSRNHQPELGSIIAMARPDGNAEGIGVISVLERSLREKDKAYLGVMMDFTKAGKNGVPLQRVMPDSAAHNAGLRNGDTIISIDRKAITGAMEMRNLLQRLTPGSQIKVKYRRGNTENSTTVKLGSRADNTDIRRVPRERMNRMERMGATPNRVRSNFPSVIQSDIPINAPDTGAPVIDLDGNPVGIVIARGSRIKTFIIPTNTLRKVLAFDPTPPKQALAKRPESKPATPPQQPVPTTEDDPTDKLRQLLGEIEKNTKLNQDLLRELKRQLEEQEENQP